MKIISVRSPYIISVNEETQDYGKLELRIWKPNTTKPTEATYTFTKGKSSDTNREVTFNISPFVKDLIENKIEFTAEGDLTAYNYANVEVKTFYKAGVGEWTALSTEQFIAFNGYNNFEDGANQSKVTTEFQDLTTYQITPFGSIPLYYDRNRLSEYYIQLSFPDENINIEFVNSLNQKTDVLIAGDGIWNLPISTDESKFDNGNYLNIQTQGEFGDWLTIGSLNVIPVCEHILTPAICTYVNRNGAIQQLTFFKMRTDTIDATSDKYNLMPSNWNYDANIGTYKQFNFNAKKSVRLNTGWVTQEYSDMMQDLLLSENIWLDDKPVTIKTQSLEVKTQVRNKNINYEVEFEYGFDIINSVI